MRLLRAGLPQPRPDDHAAPADRPASRDRAPGRGSAAAGASGGVRLRRARDLCRRRHLRAHLPGRDRHRPAGQAPAGGPPLAAGRAGGAAPCRALGIGRARGARRPAGRAAWEHRCAARRAARKAIGDELVPNGRPTCRSPRRPGCRPPRARRGRRSICPPASTGSSGAPQRRRGAAEPARGDGGRLGASRAGAVDPGRRRRTLLRHPLVFEGLCRGRAPDGEPYGQRAGAGATAASCRSSAMRRRARSASPSTRCRC